MHVCGKALLTSCPLSLKTHPLAPPGGRPARAAATRGGGRTGGAAWGGCGAAASIRVGRGGRGLAATRAPPSTRPGLGGEADPARLQDALGGGGGGGLGWLAVEGPCRERERERERGRQEARGRGDGRERGEREKTGWEGERLGGRGEVGVGPPPQSRTLALARPQERTRTCGSSTVRQIGRSLPEEGTERKAREREEGGVPTTLARVRQRKWERKSGGVEGGSAETGARTHTARFPIYLSPRLAPLSIPR